MLSSNKKASTSMVHKVGILWKHPSLVSGTTGMPLEIVWKTIQCEFCGLEKKEEAL